MARSTKLPARVPVDIDGRAALTLTREVAILRRFARCGGCGGPLSLRKDWVYDHELALELGGSDDVSNLRPLCHPCDKPKTARDQALIAKAKRLAGETCAGPSRRPMAQRKDHTWPSRPMQGRGFDKRGTRDAR